MRFGNSGTGVIHGTGSGCVGVSFLTRLDTSYSRFLAISIRFLSLICYFQVVELRSTHTALTQSMHLVRARLELVTHAHIVPL